MIALFPVPGLLAKRIQEVQNETMKRVGFAVLKFWASRVDFEKDRCPCPDGYRK
jgi:hypothetical protein